MTPMQSHEITYFKSPRTLRAWFERHHKTTLELWVGFHKKQSGLPSVTYQEALDEALCFGWIDGIRKSVDGTSYTIRFTPRKPRSYWSAVNVRRVGELTEANRMQPSGIAAFQRRDPERTEAYSFERASVKLNPVFEKEFRSNTKAWEYFQSKPPSYRKPAIWWVMSAKQEETRRRRLGTLIADSAEGRTIPPLTRQPKQK
jgi:uncharacterized protein YdeI (YjbR/CyaY-like superfamily)